MSSSRGAARSRTLPLGGYDPHPPVPGTPRQRVLIVAIASVLAIGPSLLASAALGPFGIAPERHGGGLPSDAASLVPLFGIGAVGGVLSGLLGVGGAVVLLPLLTGLGSMSLKQASNVTVVQVVAAALVSVAAHYRRGLIHVRLALVMGGASLAGGLAGGYGSAALPSVALEALFLLVVCIAVALLFIPVGELASREGALPPVNSYLAAGLGFGVGALAGVLGAGGGFLIVPLLMGALRLPTRLAIGTSPAVILLGSAAALAGKAASRQILFLPAVAVVAGAVPFTYLGARIGTRLSPRALRAMLALVLAAIAVRSGLTLAGTLVDAARGT